MIKKISILFIIIMFLFAVFINQKDRVKRVENIISPVRLIVSGEEFIIKSVDTLDTTYTFKNKTLAKALNITEDEAFIIGNIGKQWAENLLKNRKIFIKNDDIIYSSKSYLFKLENSGYCFRKNKPTNQKSFNKIITYIRNGKFKIYDSDNDSYYPLEDFNKYNPKHYILLRESKKNRPSISIIKEEPIGINQIYQNNFYKVILTDFTNKFKPNRNCDSSICKEILNNINNSKTTIDMAIYGYSSIPAIENALIDAISRGVEIRLIYDEDSRGNNIYPDTNKLKNIIINNRSDSSSIDSQNIMHNKFYIFDNKVLITGSANLSHTDMSEFNTNSIIILKNPEIISFYKKEFEQMFLGKFHSEKNILSKNKEIKFGDNELKVAFSPQDKTLTNEIIPLINNAKNYIYAPTFILTEKRVAEALVNAKKRGVDVKIIIDALNASIRHTKHKELRLNNIPVKTEIFAGKMHSKSIIIDDKYTIIGSMNFSNSGENRNDENLIIIKDEQLAKFYKKFFLYQWNKIDSKWLNHNARAESLDSIGSCFDGLDNDYDGLIDKEDPACRNLKLK